MDMYNYVINIYTLWYVCQVSLKDEVWSTNTALWTWKLLIVKIQRSRALKAIIDLHKFSILHIYTS